MPQRTLVYQWRKHDAQFAHEFTEAAIEATEALEEEARRRAADGVTTVTPIYYNGVLVDSVEEIKYSDTLLIFLLKALNPAKYRERLQLQHAGSEGEQIIITELRAIEPKALPAPSGHADSD